MISFDKDGHEIFSFSNTKEVDTILEKEPGYFSWIQNADFPLY
jgi:DNA polymerase-3 subunit epsilon